jgi:hypothetical protein
VEKIEADLRQGPGRLAGQPLELVGAVMVTDEPDDGGLLSTVDADAAANWLVANQPYAAGQPGWQAFAPSLVRRGVYRLRRGRDPQASVHALRQLLGVAVPPLSRTGTPTFPEALCTQER